MPEPKPHRTAPPRLDFATPRVVAATQAEDLRAGDEREGEQFASADLTGHDLSHTSFTECEFTSITLTDTQLRSARFRETLITGSFAIVLPAERTTWRDVRIELPRWGMAELFDADLTSFHIRGGKIDYLNFRNSRLTDVLIEETTITELDLGGFRGTRVALANCRIGTLDLTKATCTDVDLRTSEFSTINGLDGFGGTTIDNTQLTHLAPLLAIHLGIIVE